MDISKFKFELYDILAVLLPGLLLLCSAWVLLRGWHSFVTSLLMLSGTGFTVLLLVAFPIGHLIQELGDAAFKKTRGERYFKSARDGFWACEDGKRTKELIALELGFEPSVDTAFDFCLTKIKSDFPKRDSFLATSDFCRSLLVVSILFVPALGRVLLDVQATPMLRAIYAGALLLVLSLSLYLFHRRMIRFRGLSETPVFTIYLASTSRQPEPDSVPAQADDSEE